MYKIVKADKDNYITNKFTNSVRKENANVGYAGTLDLFKLYGVNTSGSTQLTELSRLLIHFDLSGLRTLVQEGKIDTNDPSFFCKLNLKDVYGGQPTPVNFSVSVFPLSASFAEGIGRDVVYYTDYDVSNWLSSSSGTTWYVSGCGLACFATGSGDYITSSVSIANTEVTQSFVTGEEDLIVDVTSIVSATLSGELPDSGFRISFKNTLEDNNKTYFVKRFASRQAYDESKRPKLTIGFDDSITEDSQNLTFDANCKLNLYNYTAGSLSNIVSGSSLTQITGSNSIILKLSTEVSGGYYNLFFTGSQHTLGSIPVSGIYSATVNISSYDATIKSKLVQSGSVDFIPVWCSTDGSVAYVTGSTLTASPSQKTAEKLVKNYVVTMPNVKSSYRDDERVLARLNIFDNTSPLIKLVKLPVTLPGVVLRNVYYQIRDHVTNEVIVPFDETKNSTKASSDSEGMFFEFETSNLMAGRSYVIDVLINQNGTKNKFTNVSEVFTIEKNTGA